MLSQWVWFLWRKSLTFWLTVKAEHLQMTKLHPYAHFLKVKLPLPEKHGIFQVIRRITRENWRRFGSCAAGKKNVSNDPVWRTITLQGTEKTEQPVGQGGTLRSEVKQFSLTWLWLWGQDHPQSWLGKLHLESLLKGHWTGNQSVQKLLIGRWDFQPYQHTGRYTVNLAISKCNWQGQKMNVEILPSEEFLNAKVFFLRMDLGFSLFIVVLFICFLKCSWWICQMKVWTPYFYFYIIIFLT